MAVGYSERHRKFSALLPFRLTANGSQPAPRVSIVSTDTGTTRPEKYSRCVCGSITSSVVISATMKIDNEPYYKEVLQQYPIPGVT